MTQPTTDDLTARKGVLKHLARSGGALHIKELHEFSTLRFGRGHQAFSLLMEGLVSDELVAWDGERFLLTDKGRDSTRGMLM
jgi:hypothetical protein